MLIQNIPIVCTKSQTFLLEMYEKLVKKSQKRLLTSEFVGLWSAASVFFSMLLQHFVALEKFEKTILKLTCSATRLVQLRARIQLTILVISIYQTNVLYLKSYQSLFLVIVFIRFCSAWKAHSNHMKTSPMAYPIHTTNDKITANGIFHITLYRNKMKSCAFHG